MFEKNISLIVSVWSLGLDRLVVRVSTGPGLTILCSMSDAFIATLHILPLISHAGLKSKVRDMTIADVSEVSRLFRTPSCEFLLILLRFVADGHQWIPVSKQIWGVSSRRSCRSIPRSTSKSTPTQAPPNVRGLVSPQWCRQRIYLLLMHCSLRFSTGEK